MNAPRPRPGIMDIAPYVGGRAALPGIDRVIRLASNETPLGASPRARDAYRAQSESLHRYPDGGANALRAALGRHHGIDPARVVCGAGSDELISLLCRAYAGLGDEVLYSEHGFLMYAIAARVTGATPVAAPESGLRSDVDALLAAVTPKTRLVFLANPNNPTGSFITRDELDRLHTGLPPEVLLVVDGAYAEYVTRNDYASGLELARTAPNVVALRTFSKIYGLSALRIGWSYGSAEVAGVLNRVRGPFNVSAAALAAAEAALDDVPFTDAARTHNDIWLPWLSAELARIGLVAHPSVGNFILVEFPDGDRNADAANDFLNGRGIIPRKVANYGLPRCLRITVGLEDEMADVVAALNDFMS
ncbi:MAG: histidinol-phosphate transaminase [Alphaproteobacteria bacterium]|nr:histidinol-phosphate transaminase [Alphaproteobacteria bacterium]